MKLIPSYRKSLDWGTDMLVVSANRNKVIRVTVYLASNENDQNFAAAEMCEFGMLDPHEM